MCATHLNGATAELRLHYAELLGWCAELHVNGRLLATQRCASEEEALEVVREMQRSWANDDPDSLTS